MKTNKLLVTALMSAVLVGCSQDDLLKQANDAPVVYTGSMEKTTSRVLLEQDYMMSWENGDLLTIFPKYDINNQYRVSTIDNNGLATFEYVDYVEKKTYAEINNTYAVYPYYTGNDLNGEVISTEVPSVINYEGMENSIKYALMSAKSGTSNLNFTNAQGILRLSLNAVTPFKYGAIQSITLTSKANLLSGKAEIDYSNGNTTPVAVITEGENTLTINLSEALQQDLPSAKSDGWAEFYIPVVPTQFAYEDLKLTIVGRNGESFERPVRLAFGIERKKIYTLFITLDDQPTYSGELEGSENAVFVANRDALQTAIDNATADAVINVGADITGDVTVTQKPGVNITIVGQGFKYNGMITVDGKSATYTTAGLTIKDLNFAAESISGDACIRLGDGTNATRYTCNVTVENCTFDVPGAVGIKSYTGGDKNLTIKDCTVTEKAHSLVQAKGIEGVLVEGCAINSKNGMNFNNSNNVVIDDCTANVRGYAARFGEGSAATGAAETYSIKNSTLESACEESGDAVIVLRGSADNATLTLENTTLVGTPKIANNATGAKVIVGGKAIISTLSELQAKINNGETEITLDTDIMGTVVMKSNVTINGNGYQLGSVNLNGASNVTLKNIAFDAAKAVPCVDGQGTYKMYANIMTGVWQETQAKQGAFNLVIDNCTFTGNFKEGKPGTSIAFADYYRTSGFSGNITIKNCTFDTVTDFGGYDIYGYYTGNSTNGYGDFVIENNTFKSERTQGMPVYLGKYASSIPVVVKGNAFNTVDVLENAVYVQDHSSYGVSVNAENNTFAN